MVGAIIRGFLSAFIFGRDVVTGFNPEGIVAFPTAVILIAVSRMFAGRGVRA